MGEQAMEAAQQTSGLTRGLCELTLETPDPDALAAFYRDLFGWGELSRQDGRVWLGCGDRARLGLWSPGPKEFGDEGGRHVHIALSVAQGCLDQVLERLSG